MAEIKSPATIEPVRSTGTIEYDDSDNEPLVSVAERRRKYNRVKKFAGTMAVASIAALALVGSAGSESSAGSIESDLTGSQVLIVCASPKNVVCEVDRARQAGEGMLALLNHPEHGAPGFSMRISMKNGQMIIIPVQLDNNISEIAEMARISEENASTPGNLMNYIEDQVHTKIGNDPFAVYATFLSGTPPLGKEGYACSPAAHWNGIAAGRNVLVQYLTSTCDPGNPYHGFRAPHARMLSQIMHNDGFLERGTPGFIDSNGDDIGYSNEPFSLLGYDINSDWFYRRLTPSIFEPGRSGGTLNLAEESRWAWQANITTNGQRSIGLFSENSDGVKKAVELDPGNRLPAGSTIEARYSPAAGEKFKGWNGACKGIGPCEFIVNQVINLQAVVEQVASPQMYEVSAKAKGFSIIGMGKKCVEKCKALKKANSSLELRAVPLPANKDKLKFLGWVGCNKVVKRSVAGMVCLINKIKSDRTVIGKSKTLAQVR